jgi:hypothetical protein
MAERPRFTACDPDCVALNEVARSNSESLIAALTLASGRVLSDESVASWLQGEKDQLMDVCNISGAGCMYSESHRPVRPDDFATFADMMEAPIEPYEGDQNA